MKKTLVLLCFFYMFIEEVQAQYMPGQPVFYRSTLNAIAAGMGNASLATDADANVIFSNMAKLPSILNGMSGGGLYSETYSIGIQHLNSSTVSYGAYSYSDDQHKHFSIGFRRLDAGSPEFSQEKGNNYKDWDVEAGYADFIDLFWSYGITAKFVHSELAVGNTIQSAMALSADISFYYNESDQLGEGFKAGMVLSNLGSKLDYAPDNDVSLPIKLGIAGANTWVTGINDNKATMSLEVSKLLCPNTNKERAQYQSMNVPKGIVNDNSAVVVSCGFEYIAKYDLFDSDAIAFRGGYVANTSNFNVSGVTGGIGLIPSHGVRLDIAYCVTRGTPSIKNIIQVGFSIGF